MDGYEITIKETEQAMRKIGKNKAVSYDGLTDLLFQRKHYLSISYHGTLPEDNEHSKMNHQNIIQKTIAEKLTEYLNYCIKEQPRLLYNQDLLEQIYIPKDDSDYKTFYNSRPITKTSPMYKLLDTILNN